MEGDRASPEVGLRTKSHLISGHRLLTHRASCQGNVRRAFAGAVCCPGSRPLLALLRATASCGPFLSQAPQGGGPPVERAHRFVPWKRMAESQPGPNWVFRLMASRLQEFTAPVCRPPRLRLKSRTAVPGHGFAPPVCGHSVQRAVDTAPQCPWGNESMPYPSASLRAFSGQPSSPHDVVENLPHHKKQRPDCFRKTHEIENSLTGLQFQVCKMEKVLSAPLCLENDKR